MAAFFLLPALLLGSPATPQTSFRLHGFIDAYWEKVADTPAGVDADGRTVFEKNPHEFDVANVHVMLQGSVGQGYRYYLNLAAPGSGGSDIDEHVRVRNAWVEVALAQDYLNLRWGKTYRRFGLYNEILDAVPTFIGIEPPELFDKDHLMLTRTTNLMVHGQWSAGEHALAYALMTGNDERAGDELPLGVDLHYDWGTTLRVGSSFYTTNGDAGPTRAVGGGSPHGGVANWMASDDYLVYGGYAQLQLSGFLFETEWWWASHRARRDPAAVLRLLDAGLNSRQLERFGLDGPNPTAADVPVAVDYVVATRYVRLGYAFSAGGVEFTPYAQGDFYRNRETIQSKRFGGDNEAGLSDDGVFGKPTLGLVVRPVPAVAFKIDGSTHIQTFNGETIAYPEVRTSLSYFWQLPPVGE